MPRESQASVEANAKRIDSLPSALSSTFRMGVLRKPSRLEYKGAESIDWRVPDSIFQFIDGCNDRPKGSALPREERPELGK